MKHEIPESFYDANCLEKNNWHSPAPCILFLALFRDDLSSTSNNFKDSSRQIGHVGLGKKIFQNLEVNFLELGKDNI